MNIMGANWWRYWDLKDKFVEKAKDINSGVGIIKQSNENTDGENHDFRHLYFHYFVLLFLRHY